MILLLTAYIWTLMLTYCSELEVQNLLWVWIYIHTFVYTSNEGSVKFAYLRMFASALVARKCDKYTNLYTNIMYLHIYCIQQSKMLKK